MVEVNGAVGAYQNALKQASEGSEKKSDGPSFGDMLKESLGDAIETQHKSEQMSAAAVQGKADMIDVLQAVTEAETTLNTVLSIRDRLVQSYQEIMRMPI
ncbi:MAG: flagellar hook-basal body complex protein FliE [Pseudomonadota bacterium]